MRKKLLHVPTSSDVLDKNGGTWTVAEFSPDGKKVRLEREGSKPWVLSTDLEVEVAFEALPMISGVSERELAEQVIHAHLDPNAITVAAYDDGKTYAPTKFPDAGSMLAHLYVLHGWDVTDLGDKTLPELEKLHSADHSDRAAGSKFKPHFHNDARFRQ